MNTNEITVTITRTLPSMGQGWVRKQTRAAIIRQARREHPEHADHAAVEITYDHTARGEQRVTFLTTEPASLGF
jgi:hypothetical protein